jgi:predicted MFS family arabinose efflux permease
VYSPFFTIIQEEILSQVAESSRLTKKLDSFFGTSIYIISVIFMARFIIDMTTRMLLPFIPQISAGLGLTVVGFSWLLFLRSLVNVAGPVFGMWSDRYGRRQMMAIGLLCQAVGVLGLALSWQWWATLPIIISGLSIAAFVPAQQAYISDQVAYRKRGRALATVEFGWSTSAIVSLPIVGWMIDTIGWRSPFLLLSLISLGGTAIVWWGLPPASEHRTHAGLSWTETRTVFLKANVLATVGVALLVFVGVSMFMAVWGVWLTTDFQFNATSLGWVATAVGLAELGGAIVSSLFIDRIGKKRGSQLGLLLTVAIFLTLPLTQASLWLAIPILILLGLLFEFIIVSLIPLYSEQVPEARGTVLALTVLGLGLGSAIGTPIATTLWQQSGLSAVAIVGAAALLVALGLVWNFLVEASAPS